MDLMNEREYTKACLFRIREALDTIKAKWEAHTSLDEVKIFETIAMLQDTIDELNYFNKKIGDIETDHSGVDLVTTDVSQN